MADYFGDVGCVSLVVFEFVWGGMFVVCCLLFVRFFVFVCVDLFAVVTVLSRFCLVITCFC